MASLVMGVAGAALLAPLGPMGAQIGFALGSAAAGLLFPPKGPDGPRLTDLTVHTSAYGNGIPIPYGTTRQTGNIIWADKIQEHESEQGGKGGPEYTMYSYTCSLAVSICAGPIAGITRIWADGLLIYDVRPENTGEQVVFKAGAYKLYLGTETQLPDPTIQALIGDTPAYRGQAYFVFTDLELGKFGNRIPSLSFEVVHKADSEIQPPVKYGKAVYIAQDPVTGFIWAPNYADGTVEVYDPVEKVLVTTVSLPSQGEPGSSPLGIIYVDGQFVIGNDAPNYFETIGWGIFPEQGALFRYTGYKMTYPGGAYWHPGVPSRSGQFFGTSGLGGGVSFNPTAEIEQYDPNDGETGPAALGYVGTVIISPDASDEVLIGYAPWLAINSTNETMGIEVTNPDWSGASAWGNLVVFNDKERTLYWGNQYFQGVYEVDRDSGALRLVIPDIKPEILLYSPDSNLLYVQHGHTTFTTYAPSETGEFQKVQDFEGMGIGTVSMETSAIYLGNEEWAFAMSSSGGNLYSIKFRGTLDAHPALLSDIVQDVSVRCGLSPADIDVSELTDLVDGYCVTHQMAGRSAIEPLMQAYFFDPVESDYQIKFRKRGRPAVVTILDDDLAAHSSGSEAPDLIEIRRKQELDLPQIVNIKYINPAADYQTSTQYEARQTGRSNSAVTVDLPIVMSDDKAKQVAAAAIYTAWAERTGLSFATSLAYAKYEPTDCFIVHNRLVRIVHRKRNGGVIEWEGYADGNTIYPSDTINQGGAAAPAGPVGQVLIPTPLTKLEIMGTPLLQDTDAGPGFYLAAAGMGPGWTGSQVWKSIDGGVSYQPMTSVPNASLIGTVSGTLGAYLGGDTFDEINTFTVTLIENGATATPASATEQAVLSGANAFLVGGEVVQAKRVVLNDDGSYTFSGLLRYRRGTDGVTHAAGERFVALTSNLVRVPVATSEIGLPRKYKAITNGGTLVEAQAVEFTYEGNDLKPYAPVHIGGWRAPNGDLTITAVRRTRTGGEFRDGVEVPVGEAVEAYEVEILDGATVRRTFTGLASPAVVYTAEQQVADFGSAQATVHVRFFQMSSVVGRGFPGTGAV